MHLNERIATLDRLIMNAEDSLARYGLRAERLGYDCFTLSLPVHPTAFSEAWMQRRYEQGYQDAQSSSLWGDGLTFSPIEVGMLKATME